MRLIKGVILAVTGLFIVVTLFSLLMPSRVMTVKSVVIHGNVPEVFEKISNLENWKQWHPVFMQDTTAVRFSNPSFGNHAFAEWTKNGKQIKLLVTALVPGQLNASLLRDGAIESDNIILVTPLNDLNNVQAEWRVVTKLKWYPWEKFSGIFIDNITGPGYETALNNLKELIEGKP
ncbi:MAG: hypothetical protein KBF74_00035 [Ferruginibacter sp.]|nr:hypothetical protein [Ferruginibacter sp.]